MLWHFFSFYFSSIPIIFRYLLLFIQNLSPFPKYPFIRNTISDLFRAPIIVIFIDTMLSLYFHLCNLSPCTVDLDYQTTVHFWTPNHRKFNKPNLVIIHGYGGTSRWQFVHQVRLLSNRFNLYVPDLIFFGKSSSTKADRTDVFQAKCMAEGLKRLGVDRFSVYGISYGGFVAYRMAEMNPQEIDKVVIVSSAIGYTQEQKEWHLERIGRRISGFLVPESPQDLRLLVTLTMYNHDFLKWVPDYIFRQFITVMHETNRKQQVDMIEYLLNRDANPNIPILTQETLIIWGDQDNLFPLDLAHQLHRHLGSKSKLVTLKNTGHAANMESPHELNTLINSFLLGHSYYMLEVMHETHRKEQEDMIEYLLNRDANPNIPILTRETLIIWGDQDNLFPLDLAHQLHRHLGSKSKLVTLKNTGHAANMESPHELNTLINSFLLGHSYYMLEV